MNEFRVGSTNPPTASSWSAEEDADLLMDDVFADIDSLLSGKKPNATIQSPLQSDYTSLQSLVVPQINLEGSPFEEKEAEVQLKRGWGYYTERLFFMGSCASLLGVALWMSVNDRLRMPQFLSQTAPVAEVATSSTAEADADSIFADYVRRALDNIDRKQAAPLAPTAPQAVTAPEQNPPAAAGNAPQLIERIYIPVYPPEVAANATAPIAGNQTTQTPTPQVVQPSQPSAVLQETPSKLVPPPAPNTLNSAIPTLPSPPAATKELYTLVGVLESGDRSAALFNIGGATRRFKVGENIGASNWKIIAIQNQQILMGLGGQTRTLYVGQNFSAEDN